MLASEVTVRSTQSRNAMLFRSTFSNKPNIMPSSNTGAFTEVEVMEIQSTDIDF